MNEIFFRPLEMFDLQGFLTRHTDWLYFALIVALFISIAGITLKKHFDQPYVKPLIITAGLILAVAAFRNKHVLSLIFNGWGTLGYVLLLLIAAMIPYGLAKGFGLPTSKAAWLTYILMYFIAWASFPDLFAMLSDRGMALLNLALFILFFVAIWKVFRLRLKSATLPNSSEIKEITKPKPKADSIPAIGENANPDPLTNVEQVERASQAEKQELEHEAAPITFQEIKSIDELETAFNDILKTLKNKWQKLERSDREHIAQRLAWATRQENVFFGNLQKLEKIFKKIKFLDSKELSQLRIRANSATADTKRIIKAELMREKEKHIIYEALQELGGRLRTSWGNFVMYLNAAMNALHENRTATDALSNFYLAKKTLKNMKTILLSLSDLEKRMITILKEERNLLRKEKKAA